MAAAPGQGDLPASLPGSWAALAAAWGGSGAGQVARILEELPRSDPGRTVRPGALLRVLGVRIRRGPVAGGEQLQQWPSWARSGALVRSWAGGCSSGPG